MIDSIYLDILQVLKLKFAKIEKRGSKEGGWEKFPEINKRRGVQIRSGDWKNFRNLISGGGLLLSTKEHWHLGEGETTPPYDLGKCWSYDHAIFTRFQIPQGGMNLKKNDITHVLCKLWICKIQEIWK